MNNTLTNSTPIYKILPDCDNDTDSMSVSSYEEIISPDDKTDLLEMANELIILLIDENPLIFMEPDYQENISEKVYDVIYNQISSLYKENIENEINDIIINAFKIVHKYIYPKRSFLKTFIRKLPRINKLYEKITYLKNKYQPEQKTHEWYLFRYEHLTASNIWKAFMSQANINQLIYEKCKPFNADKYNNSLTDGPLHWGVKYENLSIMFYEKHYSTTITDFGCILHDNYTFLAASPDGINTNILSPRYGRMLEIKNIVNRDITGIPKLEHWVQMQIQMEVCNLNECDFLETRFIEYDSEEAYLLDGSNGRTSSNDLKGHIICFIKDNKPYYEYEPLELSLYESLEWKKAIMEKNIELEWFKNIYWKLDEFSCILVLRNKHWFKNAIPILQSIWNTIQIEKISGFQHRAPKIREKKCNSTENEILLNGNCYIDIE